MTQKFNFARCWYVNKKKCIKSVSIKKISIFFVCTRTHFEFLRLCLIFYFLIVRQIKQLLKSHLFIISFDLTFIRFSTAWLFYIIKTQFFANSNLLYWQLFRYSRSQFTCFKQRNAFVILVWLLLGIPWRGQWSYSQQRIFARFSGHSNTEHYKCLGFPISLAHLFCYTFLRKKLYFNEAFLPGEILLDGVNINSINKSV